MKILRRSTDFHEYNDQPAAMRVFLLSSKFFYINFFLPLYIKNRDILYRRREIYRENNKDHYNFGTIPRFDHWDDRFFKIGWLRISKV